MHKAQTGDVHMKSSKRLSTFTNLMREWDYEKNHGLNPEKLSYGSKVVASWICSKCHSSWSTAICNRTRVKNPSGCPYCAGQRVLPGINDLASQFPRLIKEWSEKNLLSPDQVCCKTSKKYFWTCAFGHEWEASVSNRTKGCGCPYDCGKLPILGETDLESVYPAIAAQWDYDENQSLSPSQVTAFSHKVVGWKCPLGHKWKQPVERRVCAKYPCPVCEGFIIIPGINDLVTLFPVIAAEWDYESNGSLNPHKLSPHSGKYANWKCAKGHGWRTTIDARTSGTECPYCQGNLAIKGENDLATLFPDLAAEWDFENNRKTPDQVKPMSQYRASWRCVKNHRWKTTVYQRVYCKTGCPFCSGRRPIPGQTDLATLRPDLAREWDYDKNRFPPSHFTCGSSSKAWWRCHNDHSWHSTINSRVRGCGCPHCENWLDLG